jgi:hypothetical protein
MSIATMRQPCACGKIHRVEAQHYDRIIVECGLRYWALQPKSKGPLVLFPWPGPNLTREEMTGKKSADQIVKGMAK